jgi:hypothetical protein
MGAILFLKTIIVLEDNEALMSTLLRQVAEEECCAKKVSRKNPRELRTGGDQVEAKIIVFGLTTSS